MKDLKYCIDCYHCSAGRFCRNPDLYIESPVNGFTIPKVRCHDERTTGSCGMSAKNFVKEKKFLNRIMEIIDTYRPF